MFNVTNVPGWPNWY